jgi:hypothetical protein
MEEIFAILDNLIIVLHWGTSRVQKFPFLQVSQGVLGHVFLLQQASSFSAADRGVCMQDRGWAGAVFTQGQVLQMSFLTFEKQMFDSMAILRPFK